jgi:hypothetical protein
MVTQSQKELVIVNVFQIRKVTDIIKDTFPAEQIGSCIEKIASEKIEDYVGIPFI